MKETLESVLEDLNKRRSALDEAKNEKERRIAEVDRVSIAVRCYIEYVAGHPYLRTEVAELVDGIRTKFHLNE